MLQKESEVKKPEKLCFNCETEAQYKCPKCMIRYCKVECFKQHKESCKPIKKAQKRPRIEPYSGEDTVERTRLEQLEFRHCLTAYFDF